MERRRIITLASIITAVTALLAWGAIAGAGQGMGIVAAPDAATIAAADQPGATDRIVIDRVVAPGPAFVVVHQEVDGRPGMRLGHTAVPAGTSTRVVVELEDPEGLTPKVIAALHADHAAPGRFEFDMDDMAASPDRPYFVDGEEVAAVIAVR